MARRSAGEGFVFRRNDGLWQAALRTDGRRRTVYGKTRAEAAARFEEIKAQA